MESKERQNLRCAIYTCKSVEDGLEQEFNSLDAQREAGENFIASQKANGWKLLPTRYDDGGFSDGNTNRPALQQLLADCEAGKIDVIVVYKIDPLAMLCILRSPQGEGGRTNLPEKWQEQVKLLME